MQTTIFHDMNNAVIRCLFSTNVIQRNLDGTVGYIDWEYWEYLVFSSIYQSIVVTNNVNDVVLAVDGNNTWRKSFWKRYKETRKEKREAQDEVDWDVFFGKYSDLQDEFRKHLPFKIIKLDGAEGDDIIGTLVIANTERSHIVSVDKDFTQLYKKGIVSIYNPITKLLVEHPSVDMWLLEEIFTGQKKDFILNLKTPLDIPLDVRKPGFGTSAFEKVVVYGWEKWLTDNNLWDRYEMNKTLIDFARIPEKVQTNIKNVYSKYETPALSMVSEFFKIHPWPEYLEKMHTVETTLGAIS